MAVHTRSLNEIAILNKDLVLADLPPLDGQIPYFLILRPFPNLIIFLEEKKVIMFQELEVRDCNFLMLQDIIIYMHNTYFQKY